MARRGSNLAQRADVEAIVREVLAELAGREPIETRPNVARGPLGESIQTNQRGDLVVGTKVISTADLENRLEGVRRVVVPRGAVVTPAARDLLRERTIAIAAGDCNRSRNTTRGEVVVATIEIRTEPRDIVATITGAGYHVTRLPVSGLPDTVTTLCRHVAHGQRRGLLMTDKTAAAVCLANRRRGVRAALGTTPAATTSAMRTVAPNLLVVDPDSCSALTVNDTIGVWLSAEGQCLPELQEQLG